MPAANLLSVESEIQSVLNGLVSQVAGLRTGSVITLLGTAKIYELLPAVFIRPAPPVRVEQAGDQIQERQLWEVVAAVPAVPDKQNLDGTYQALGELAAAVVQALHGHETAAGALEYTGREDIVEELGRAELALQFELTVLLDVGVPPNLDDFERFFADWDLGPEPDGTADAEDNVTLPIQGDP